MSFRMTFDDSGGYTVDENAVPTAEELKAIKEQEKTDKAEAKEQAEINKQKEEQEKLSSMTTGEIKSYFKNGGQAKTSQRRSALRMNSTGYSLKQGRQKLGNNVNGEPSVKRTYIMEMQALNKIDEIKVYMSGGNYTQVSDIINRAVDCYYEKLKEEAESDS